MKQSRTPSGCLWGLFICMAALLGAFFMMKLGALPWQGTACTAPSATPASTTGEADWALLLVNHNHPLPDGYTCRTVTLTNGEQVDERIYPSLQKMFDAMRKQGLFPIVASGYRTRAMQEQMMQEKVDEYKSVGFSDAEAVEKAKDWVALPGTSEHESGLAVDINADGIHSTGNQIYTWLDEHAWEYGFIKRYPDNKTAITGIRHEPWHYRYVGKAAAKEIWEQGVCLEEYLG